MRLSHLQTTTKKVLWSLYFLTLSKKYHLAIAVLSFLFPKGSPNYEPHFLACFFKRNEDWLGQASSV